MGIVRHHFFVLTFTSEEFTIGINFSKRAW